MSVFNLVASAVDGLFNLGSNQQQYSNDIKAMDHQQSLNIDMWNMQNAYNDPSAQRERLESAGMNPNLIYGTSAAGASGNSSSAPQSATVPSKKTQNYVQASQALQNYFSTRQQQAQTNNIQEDTRLKMEDAKNRVFQRMFMERQSSNMDAQTQSVLLDNVNKRVRNKYAENLLKWDLENKQVQYRNSSLSADLLDVRKRYEDSLLSGQVDALGYKNKQSRLDYLFNSSTFDQRKDSINLENRLKNANLLTQQYKNARYGAGGYQDSIIGKGLGDANVEIQKFLDKLYHDGKYIYNGVRSFFD